MSSPRPAIRPVPHAGFAVPSMPAIFCVLVLLFAIMGIWLVLRLVDRVFGTSYAGSWDD